MRSISIYIPPLFYCCLALLFFADLCFFSFLEKPYLNSVLCFFILSLFHKPTRTQISIQLIALALIALVYYGRFGITLAYLIPLTLAGRTMARDLYPAWWYPYVLLAGCLLLQIVFIERIILHFPISAFYTVSLICVNVIVMFIISLKH